MQLDADRGDTTSYWLGPDQTGNVTGHALAVASKEVVGAKGRRELS